MIVSTLAARLSGLDAVSERGRRNEDRCGMRRCQATQGLKLPHSKNALRSGSRGAVEFALDHENGNIVVEVIAAKICSCIIDAGHEVFGGHRRTTAHSCGKALHAEFFAKPVLGLGDSIGIEDQYVASDKIFQG